MKILQICHKPPLPAVDGGCIAINNITRGLLKQQHEVKVISITTPKHPVDRTRMSEDYIRQTQFESVFVDTKINFLKAFYSFFQKESYQVSRFISKDFNQKIVDILQGETFDIIQLESIFVAPYIATIRKYSNAKIVLRSHNVEHKIWGRFLLQQKSFLKKKFLKKMIRQLQLFELSVFQKIDAFMAISEPDYQYFHELFPNLKGTVVPAGIDIDEYETEDEYIASETPTLFHIGSMNWMPNIEGIEWFLKEVWGKIHENFPLLQFFIAGREIPLKWEQLRLPNVIIEGEVPDAKEFILSKDVMIVPLLSGSGVRIKILEGMALGRTIITTPIGAEGLGVESGKNIFIANTPQEFVDVVQKCINTPDLCRIIGENARDYITLYHNNDVITDEILSFYREL